MAEEGILRESVRLLLALRKLAGLSQEALDEASYFPKGTIQEWEATNRIWLDLEHDLDHQDDFHNLVTDGLGLNDDEIQTFRAAIVADYQILSQTYGTTVDERFLSELHVFAQNGYRFTEQYALWPGTQQEAFDAYVQVTQDGQRRASHVIATGAGKTAGALAIIRSYLRATADMPEAPQALFVVPTQNLIHKTVKELAQFIPDLVNTLETERGREINWQDSSIGRQYQKAKEEYHRPRVLITTFHSLSKISSPEQYGLVIYDECHALTGQAFGKAIETFGQSFQFGITATDAYSDTKHIRELLPPCYRCPVLEGIKHGVICGLHPVLLRTDYLLDEEAWRKFVEIQEGKLLTEKQSQRLLNHKARNMAVLQAYLLEKDIREQPFLGQVGLIYCVGVDHVDDFVRQAQAALLDAPSSGIRAWLESQGLELVAPVHSKRDTALLRPGMLRDSRGKSVTKGRQYSGNKEYYSKEEILELHQAGQILLLASCDELKVGYDNRRISFIADLADRYSTLEGLQILGRGLRLNRDDPDKILTFMNIIDKNSAALYAQKPYMKPVHCIDVLGDKTRAKDTEAIGEIHKPASTYYFRENASPAHIAARWETPDDTIISQTNYVLIRLQAIRQENAMLEEGGKIVPTKQREDTSSKTGNNAPPPGRKSPSMLRQERGGRTQIYKQAFMQFIEEKRQEGLSSGMTQGCRERAALLEEEIQNRWIGTYHVGGSDVLYATEEALEIILPGLKRLKERGWMTASMLAHHPDYGSRREIIEARILEYERRKQEEWPGQEEYIRKHLVGRESNRNNVMALAVSEEARKEMEIMGLLARRLEPGWMTANMLGKLHAYRGDRVHLQSFQPFLTLLCLKIIRVQF